MKLTPPSITKKRQHEAHFKAMCILQKTPDISQRELALKLGVSLGSVNYVLRSLAGKGLVKIQNFSKSKKKFSYAYILTPKGIAEKTKLTAAFLRLKLDEYQALKAEIDLLQDNLAVHRQISFRLDNGR